MKRPANAVVQPSPAEASLAVEEEEALVAEEAGLEEVFRRPMTAGVEEEESQETVGS